MSEAYILVVDDEPDIRSMLEIMLQRLGFEVMTVGDGESALNAFAARRPDAIVLDINLPGISGFDVCQAVKAQQSIPVLLITGNSIAELGARGESCGADALLTKPFDMLGLVEQLRALLDHAVVA